MKTNVEMIRDIAHMEMLDWFEKTCDNYSYYHVGDGGTESVEFEFTLLERDEDRRILEASLYHLFSGICAGYNAAVGCNVYITEVWDEEDPDKYYIDINK